MGGVDVWTHVFLTSALDGGEWSASCLDNYIFGGKALSTPWIGGSMGPRRGLDATENRKESTASADYRSRFLGCQAHTIMTEPISAKKLRSKKILGT
jgi:hypothetical protein